LRVFLVLLISLFQLQCTTLGLSRSKPQSVRIELKGKPGTSSETRYYSHANVKSYSDQQLLRDKQEIVDFTVLTTIQEYDAQEKLIKFKVKTIAKDGIVNLHDLAFPEKNEEIDYIVRGSGEVLKAGNHAPQSLFFVPALPVPKDEVEVGDTWTMEHTWYSSRDNIPLKLEVVGILKALVPCDGGKTCADIEISGGVKLVSMPTIEGGRFDSRIRGRMLFSPDRGEVIWSEMRSEEEMIVQGEKFSVVSCMASETKLGAKFKTKLECQPR